MDKFRVHMELTDKHEPIEGWCKGCGNTDNFFMYVNDINTKYMAGCCLCDTFGEVKNTPIKAVSNWMRNYLYVEQRF